MTRRTGVVLGVAALLALVLAMVLFVIPQGAVATKTGDDTPSYDRLHSLTPATPTPVATPSATTVPTGNLPGWRLTASQNFNKDAGLGKFETVYGAKLTGYNGFFDHANHGVGLYAPLRVLSTHDGLLDYYLHTENDNPLVAAVTPTGYDGQLYGRYSIRFRADLAPGYRVAFLLWPDGEENASLWQRGEIDFPETDLVPLSTDEEKPGSINGFSHDVTGNPIFNRLRYITRESAQTWHTATIEWTPKQVTFILDGKSKSTTDTAGIPTHKMHWVLQTQTSSTTGVKPAADVSGHVYVDWYAQYAYDPDTH